MPKYLLIGLGIPLAIFIIIYYWSKLEEKTKSRIIMIVFGIFLISIFVLLFLLMN